MSVGNEMVDVYNFDTNNKTVTASMLRSTFVPVRQIIEPDINGGNWFC